MKKYRVWGVATVSVFADVLADSFESAEAKARELPAQDVKGDAVGCNDFEPGMWRLHDGSQLDVELSTLHVLPEVQAEELE
jgi:hypothetical protein